MSLRSSLRLSLTAALALVALSTASAANLVLNVSGEFGPTTTLNGAPLGVNTPFSFRAVFDPDDDVNPTPGAGYFPPTTFTVDIAGHGTLAGVPNVDLNVVVLDPTYHLGVYAAGLVTSTGSPFFLNTYSTVDTPFNPEIPTPTAFANFLQILDSFNEAPYVIPLTGGGALTINDFGDAIPTASLAAIPEPATIGLLAFLSTSLLAIRRR